MAKKLTKYRKIDPDPVELRLIELERLLGKYFVVMRQTIEQLDTRVELLDTQIDLHRKEIRLHVDHLNPPKTNRRIVKVRRKVTA